MSRWVNGFVVVLSLSVLGANLWLARPHAQAFDVREPAAAPERSVAALLTTIPEESRVDSPPPAPGPFAYIHEDGREEYLPATESFEDDHAGAGFLGGQTYDSQKTVYHWTSSGSGLATSASPSWP